MLPISLVESKNFQQCFTNFDTDYIVPSRYMTMKYIHMLYEEGVNNLIKDIENTQCVGLTTDAWTSINTTSFITTTIHFIKNDELQSQVLQTRDFKVRFKTKTIILF